MILHVDMDAFYASVEERDNPSLVGQRYQELDRVADQITAKFGQSALRRGSGLGKDLGPS